MKKIIALTIILLFLVSCSENSDVLSPSGKMKYREIAYESLSEHEKDEINSDWEDADVKEGRYQSFNGAHTIIVDPENRLYFVLKNSNIRLGELQVLIIVTFNTIYDSLLGPITVIVDPKSEKVIGYLVRL
jgi:hypothetical protein